MKYIFAGDRQLSVRILEFILSKGFNPEALLVSNPDEASHSEKLRELSGLPDNRVFTGAQLRLNDTVKTLKAIAPDYIVGIHFPYIIRKDILAIPKVGFINLHPAYLPYNRGWHTPSWAILENTPIGATLHFMAEELDAGDIINQKALKVKINDTADTLYQRILDLEFETFVEAWPELLTFNPTTIKQNLKEGTTHKKRDLLNSEVQELNLNESYKLENVITKLRGLTTNNLEEAAYFLKNGKKYRLRIEITEEKNNAIE